MFDKEYYYNYIVNLENKSYLNFFLNLILFTFLFLLLAYIFNLDILLFGLLGLFLGVILGIISINRDKIKIEEMKKELDIYNNIIELKK